MGSMLDNTSKEIQYHFNLIYNNIMKYQNGYVINSDKHRTVIAEKDLLSIIWLTKLKIK